jgi:hypothetical protein
VEPSGSYYKEKEEPSWVSAFRESERETVQNAFPGTI